jgi:ElaB/YqjD/DUF883 family membrane-anchored ribosome-binding protein
MDQKTSLYSAGTEQTDKDKAASLSDPFNRGKGAIAEAANGAAKSAGSDLQAIRDDLNSLKDTVSRFMSQASDEALKSARQVTSNVAGQVSDVASDLANRSSQLAASAGDQNWACASAYLGVALALFFGWLTDRLGRKRHAAYMSEKAEKEIHSETDGTCPADDRQTLADRKITHP